MTDAQACARVWTLCLCALVLAALTGPVVVVLTPLAHATAPALTVVAAVLAAASSARMWPWWPCSPSPSGASSGRSARTAAASPPGSAAAASQHGTTGPCRGRPAWRYCGTIVAPTALKTESAYLTLVAILMNTICLRVCPWSCAVANVKYALSQNVVPSVALAPSAWSYAGPTFHTGKRALVPLRSYPLSWGSHHP